MRHPTIQVKRKNSSDWLMTQTGRSLPDWISFVQKRIKKRSRPSNDPNHDSTDVGAWVSDLEKAIEKSWKGGVTVEKVRRAKGRNISSKPFDGNMRMAATMGLILCAWYCRVQLAKTQDPNRPVKLRREAHARWCAWYQAHCISMVDGHHDPELFPGQEWESPFMPGARNGKFV